jgi:hypothetical protein
MNLERFLKTDVADGLSVDALSATTSSLYHDVYESERRVRVADINEADPHMRKKAAEMLGLMANRLPPARTRDETPEARERLHKALTNQTSRNDLVLERIGRISAPRVRATEPLCLFGDTDAQCVEHQERLMKSDAYHTAELAMVDVGMSGSPDGQKAALLKILNTKFSILIDVDFKVPIRPPILASRAGMSRYSPLIFTEGDPTEPFVLCVFFETVDSEKAEFHIWVPL